jgi:hypothetical protein
VEAVPGLGSVVRRKVDMALGVGGGAVDAQGLAGDEGGGGREQEDNGGGDLGLRAQTLQRRVTAQGAQHRLDAVGIGVEARGGDPARRHGVDAHAGDAPFGCRRGGEVDHARPRGAAVAHAGHAVPHVGDDVDDGARVVAHPLRVALPRHQETTGEVGSDYRLPALLRDRLERRLELAAGIVDEAVDAAVGLQDRRYSGRNRFLLADVAGVGGGLAAVLGDLGGDRGEPLRLAADESHRGPQAAELVGRATADAAAAAGDDDHLAGEQTLAENRLVCHVDPRGSGPLRERGSDPLPQHSNSDATVSQGV